MQEIALDWNTMCLQRGHLDGKCRTPKFKDFPYLTRSLHEDQPIVIS